MDIFPQIPQLFFELKYCCESVDFTEKLTDYIKIFYQDNPQNFKNDILELNDLRESVINVSKDIMGCNLLKRYYLYLQSLMQRFPMKENEKCAIDFSWNHIFNDTEITFSDIRIELISILYNIGALYSFLGAQNSRKADDTMKLSCKYFQHAAWCFQTINEDYLNNFNVLEDINTDLMSFMINISLAQAQECILEKSIIDKRKNTIIAKLSSHIEIFFKTSLDQINCTYLQNLIGSRNTKEWKNYINLKINYHNAIAFYYFGLSIEEDGKYGEAIAYLQVAKSKLEEYINIKPSIEFLVILKNLLSSVETKLNEIVKSNNFIYHEKIPSKDQLKDVESASVVNCLAIDLTDPYFKIDNKFSTLVPIDIHEKSSLYSEEKSKILRKFNDLIEKKNYKLQEFLMALNTDISNDEDLCILPKNLLECCASLSARPNLLNEMPKLISELISASVEIQSLIEDIRSLIEKNKVTNISNNLSELEKKYQILINKYEDANVSNVSLHSVFNETFECIKILNLPLAEIEKKIPSIEYLKDTNYKQTKSNFITLMNKVNEMKSQRAVLISQLRNNIASDDVTHKLLKNTKNYEDFFQKELKKHDEICIYIEQNLNAQENILRALGEANAVYVEKYSTLRLEIERRKKFIDLIIHSFNNVDNILIKCKEVNDYFKRLLKDFQDLFELVQSNNDNQKIIYNTVSNQYNNFYENSIDDQTLIKKLNNNNMVIKNFETSDIHFNQSFDNLNISNNSTFKRQNLCQPQLFNNTMINEISFIKPISSFKKQNDPTDDKNQNHQLNSNYNNNNNNNNFTSNINSYFNIKSEISSTNSENHDVPTFQYAPIPEAINVHLLNPTNMVNFSSNYQNNANVCFQIPTTSFNTRLNNPVNSNISQASVTKYDNIATTSENMNINSLKIEPNSVYKPGYFNTFK